MEPVSLASVVLGSAVLTALVASIAVGGIKRKSKGRQATTTIHALDSRWKKLKVDISA
jgi:hypothetical protein